MEGTKKSEYLEKERHDHGKTGVWKPRVVPQMNPKNTVPDRPGLLDIENTTLARNSKTQQECHIYINLGENMSRR